MAAHFRIDVLAVRHSRTILTFAGAVLLPRLGRVLSVGAGAIQTQPKSAGELPTCTKQVLDVFGSGDRCRRTDPARVFFYPGLGDTRQLAAVGKRGPGCPGRRGTVCVERP